MVLQDRRKTGFIVLAAVAAVLILNELTKTTTVEPVDDESEDVESDISNPVQFLLTGGSN